MNLDKVVKVIKSEKNKKFLISSHQNMEGDAIGSQLALAELLKFMGKEVVLLPPEEVPKTYRFLPGIKNMRYRATWKGMDYDAFCTVDCTDLDRLGNIRKGIDFKKPIINIDHHISNNYFGTINWVEPSMSCTGEQIFHLFKEMKAPINRNAALYMYIAILTDTGSFRYANTSAQTHEIAGELIKKGLSLTEIYRRIYEGTGRSHLALLSSVLSTLDMTRDGKIAWVKVTRDMLKEHKVGIEGTEDFVNFPRSIKGVKIALAFREMEKDIVKVSFRSNEQVDVAKLAKLLGGGGHPSASGCSLKGNMGEVEEAVLLKAKEFIHESNMRA